MAPDFLKRYRSRKVLEDAMAVQSRTNLQLSDDCHFNVNQFPVTSTSDS